MFKYPAAAIIFFIAMLLQYGFLPYLGGAHVTPNLIFIIFFLYIFFEQPDEMYREYRGFYTALAFWREGGFFIAIIAGFFLDLFSPFSFGLSILTLALVYLSIKVSSYFLKNFSEELDWKGRYVILYFLALFTVCFFMYTVLLDILSHPLHLQLSFNHIAWFASLGYNLLTATVTFFICHIIYKQSHKSNQLKLF